MIDLNTAIAIGLPTLGGIAGYVRMQERMQEGLKRHANDIAKLDKEKASNERVDNLHERLTETNIRLQGIDSKIDRLLER